MSSVTVEKKHPARRGVLFVLCSEVELSYDFTLSNCAVGEGYAIEVDAALQAAYADFVSELCLSNLCAACAVESYRSNLLRCGNDHYAAVATNAYVAGCRDVAYAAVDVGNVGNCA